MKPDELSPAQRGDLRMQNRQHHTWSALPGIAYADDWVHILGEWRRSGAHVRRPDGSPSVVIEEKR